MCIRDSQCAARIGFQILFFNTANFGGIPNSTLRTNDRVALKMNPAIIDRVADICLFRVLRPLYGIFLYGESLLYEHYKSPLRAYIRKRPGISPRLLLQCTRHPCTGSASFLCLRIASATRMISSFIVCYIRKQEIIFTLQVSKL